MRFKKIRKQKNYIIKKNNLWIKIEWIEEDFKKLGELQKKYIKKKKN
jgi:hypothetical protein